MKAAPRFACGRMATCVSVHPHSGLRALCGLNPAASALIVIRAGLGLLPVRLTLFLGAGLLLPILVGLAVLHLPFRLALFLGAGLLLPLRLALRRPVVNLPFRRALRRGPVHGMGYRGGPVLVYRTPVVVVIPARVIVPVRWGRVSLLRAVVVVHHYRGRAGTMVHHHRGGRGIPVHHYRGRRGMVVHHHRGSGMIVTGRVVSSVIIVVIIIDVSLPVAADKHGNTTQRKQYISLTHGSTLQA